MGTYHTDTRTETCASTRACTSASCCLLAVKAASSWKGAPGPSNLNRSPAKGMHGSRSSSSGIGKTGLGLWVEAWGGRTMGEMALAWG
eukprot:1158912-Pelagomonas_calceolata.AAC.7